MVFVLKAYPEVKITDKQGEGIEDKSMDNKFQFKEDGTFPLIQGVTWNFFHLLSCLKDAIKSWLEITTTTSSH